MARIGVRMPSDITCQTQGGEFPVLEFSPGFCCARIRSAAPEASDVLVMRRIPGAWVSPLHWSPLRKSLGKKSSDTWAPPPWPRPALLGWRQPLDSGSFCMTETR
eukprot:2733992-Pyramimonas_sp.AAC.1